MHGGKAIHSLAALIELGGLKKNVVGQSGCQG